MNTTGTWLGACLLGSGYGPDKGTEVPFTMSLRESWLGGFSGVVREDESQGGIPDQGTVRGKRRRRRVEFRKTMPNQHVFVHGRHVELREWILSEHGGTVTSSIPAHIIVYQGELSVDRLSMAGQWHTLGFVVRTDIGPFEFVSCAGYWKAKRTSTDVLTSLAPN